MDGRAFAHIVLLTLVSGGALHWWLAPKNPFNAAEDLLFDRLDALPSRGELKTEDVVEAFDLPQSCRSENCFAQLAMPALGNPQAHLRRGFDGIIFSVELNRVCIRTDRVTVRYRGGKIESFCDHGWCPSYGVRPDWGILSFDWPKRPSNCVEEVVLNSESYFRQR